MVVGCLGLPASQPAFYMHTCSGAILLTFAFCHSPSWICYSPPTSGIVVFSSMDGKTFSRCTMQEVSTLLLVVLVLGDCIMCISHGSALMDQFPGLQGAVHMHVYTIVIWDGALWFWSVIKTTMTVYTFNTHHVCMYSIRIYIYIYIHALMG